MVVTLMSYQTLQLKAVTNLKLIIVSCRVRVFCQGHNKMQSRADLRIRSQLVSFNHVTDPHFVTFSSSLYTTICNPNPNLTLILTRTLAQTLDVDVDVEEIRAQTNNCLYARS